MRARIARPVKTLTSVLIATIVGCVAASTTTAEAVTPGQTVAAISNGHSVSWSTPAVSARHAKIVNTVQGKHAATVIALADASAPTKYDFALKLPIGATTRLASDGSVVVLDRGGDPLGSFLKPWAKDATGRTLVTEYTLSGSTLTQIVHTDGATFPVIADPHYTWGWVTGTVYFSRSETSNARYSWYVTGPLCAGLGMWAPPAGVSCGLAAGSIAYQANTAYNVGKCLKIKIIPGSGVWGIGPGSYSGGYCA
jgi:hypothetical protein